MQIFNILFLTLHFKSRDIKTLFSVLPYFISLFRDAGVSVEKLQTASRTHCVPASVKGDPCLVFCRLHINQEASCTICLIIFSSKSLCLPKKSFLCSHSEFSFDLKTVMFIDCGHFGLIILLTLLTQVNIFCWNMF